MYAYHACIMFGDIVWIKWAERVRKINNLSLNFTTKIMLELKIAEAAVQLWYSFFGSNRSPVIHPAFPGLSVFKLAEVAPL